MSRVDPLLRFLGVPPDSDELELLGLDPTYISRAGIEAALASRLALVYDHPDGRSSDATAVRARLREAAALLLDENSRGTIIAAHAASTSREIQSGSAVNVTSGGTSQSTREMLTPLQERILLVLAGCGGWNSTSRARLASVAAANNLSPLQLVDTLRQLAGALRTGVEVAPRPSASAAVVAARALEPGFLERVIDDYAPELRQDDTRSVVKLCLLFAGIGLLSLVLMARFLFPDFLNETSQQKASSSWEAPESSSATFNGDFEGAGGVGTQAVAPATFNAPPVLRRRPIPAAVNDAVDASAEAVRMMDSFARNLIGVRELDDSMRTRWDELVDTASTGWFLVDPATGQAMRRATQRVLESAGSNPDLFQPLEQSFAPVKPDSIRRPLDVARGAWSAGMMAMLAMSETTSPAARANAAKLVQLSLGHEANQVGFDATAAGWLGQVAPTLVERLETDPTSLDQWSIWFDSLDALGDTRAVQTTLLIVLEDLLRTETDLGREGPTQQVLGRVVSELDWRNTPRVKTVVLGTFDDQEVSSSDLWLLTSLMANLDATSWYDSKTILPPDADSRMRRRLRDRLLASWPARDTDSFFLDDVALQQIDPVLAETWQSVWHSVRGLPSSRGVVPGLRQLLMERLLQEAAVDLFMDKGQRVLAVLNEVESLVEEAKVADEAPPPGSDPMIPGGQIDGNWARNYGARGRTKSDRLDLLHALEVQSGDDLGPVDAAMLATEAFGASLDIREAAGYVIGRKFSQGPNMSLALVDRFPNAKKAHDVSQLIESITGVQLPRSTTDRWQVEARLALVQHAIDLRIDDGVTIDAIGARYATSLQREARSMGRTVQFDEGPHASAIQVTAAWQDHIDQERRAMGLPGGWVDRRRARNRFAADPLQQCLAERIAASELTTWLLSSLRPSQSDQFEALAERATQNRRTAGHVLVQLVATESAMVEGWAIMMALALEEQLDDGNGGGA